MTSIVVFEGEYYETVIVNLNDDFGMLCTFSQTSIGTDDRNDREG